MGFRRKRMNRPISLLMAAAMFLSPLTGIDMQASAAVAEPMLALYVDSANGSDENAGTEEAPLQSILKARDIVRTLNDNMTSDIVVYLRGGDYTAESTIAFNEEDSGSDGYDVVYTSYPGEMAVLHAGERITNWEVHSGNIYKADVGMDWSFDVLTEDGALSTKARYPNTGYSRVEKYGAANPRSTFYFKEGDIPVMNDITDLEIFAIPGGPGGEWSWASSITGFGSVDHDTNFAQLENTVAYEMGPGSRYYIMGSMELLDAPGEFYLDKTAGALYYWPMHLPVEEQIIIAPKMRTLVQLKGSSPENRIHNVRIEGVTVTGGDRKGRDDAYHEALINIENARDVEINDNIIENSGGRGVSITEWADHNRVSGNLIRNIGADGITMISGNYQTLLYKNHHNEASNNHIYNMGQLSVGAPGIGVHNSGENVITHNLIHDGPRSAIALGGFATNGSNGAIATGMVIEGVQVTLENRHDFKHTRQNYVAYNDMYAMNQNTQDTGLIYIWGGGLNNEFVHNYIHDSNIEFSFGHGIYSDDDTDGTIIADNIIYNLQNVDYEGKLSNAIFARGVAPQIVNNLIIENNVSESTFGTQPGGAPREDFVYRNNVVYQSGTRIYGFSDWTDNTVAAAEGNLFYNDSGTYTVQGVPPGNMSLTEWKQVYNNKFDQSSIEQDPLFKSTSEEDFRFEYRSPAYGLGIHNVDRSAIGVTADFKYAAANDPIEHVFVRGEGGELAYVSLAESETAKLEVSARTKQGFVADLTDAQITFASANPAVAAVDETGRVTAVGVGLTKVEASVTLDGVTVVQDMDVAVGDALNEISAIAPVTGLLVGGQASVTVVGTSEFGLKTNLTANAVMTSSDSNVVSIDEAGRLTAVDLGTATISIEAEGKEASLEIGVYSSILNTVSLSSEAASPLAGESTQLTVAGTMTDGSVADLSPAQVRYTSDDHAIATVSEAGLLQTAATGRVNVTAYIMLNGVTKVATRSIYVRPSDGGSGGGTNTIPGWDMLAYGNAEASIANQVDRYVLTSSGGTLTGIVDEIPFIAQSASEAEASVSMTVNSVESLDSEGMVGLSFRKNDTSYAKNAFFGIDTEGNLHWNFRNNSTLPGTAAADVGVKLNFPAKLQLVKHGNIVTAYYGKEPEGYWVEAGSAAVEFRGEYLMGIAASGVEEVIAEFTELDAMEGAGSEAVLDNLVLDDDEYMLEVGSTHNASVLAQYSDGSEANVTSQASYVSSNTSVATVSAAGIVTAVEAGTAEITVSFRGRTAKATVTVQAALPPADALTAISVDDDSYELNVGDSHETQVTAVFAYPHVKKYEEDAAVISGGTIVAHYSSGYSGSGYVDGYWATGASAEWTVEAAAGEQDLTIRYANAGSTVRTASLYVNGVKIGQISFDYLGSSWDVWGTKTEKVTLQEGENTIAIVVDEGDSGNFNIDYIGVKADTLVIDATTSASYESSNPSAATVDAAGVVRATGNGDASITVTYQEKIEVIQVRVRGASPADNNGPGVPASPAIPVGKGSVQVKPSVNAEGHANARVPADLLLRAITDGTDQITVHVEAPAGTKQVGVTLPAQQLLAATGSSQRKLQVNTGLASVTLATDELAPHLGSSSSEVTITAAVVESAELPGEVRETVGNSPVFDFNLAVDGKAVSGFSGRKSVEVSFKYAPPAGADPNQVVVYYIADNGSLVTVRNGKYHPETGLVTFYPQHFSLYTAVVRDVSFADVSNAGWAEESIKALAARDIVRGVDNKQFQPFRSVTRAEFLHMLVQALELTDESAVSSFTDVEADQWYSVSVASAQKYGIVNGRADGTFGLHEQITRQEMAVMIDRTADLLGINLKNGNAETAAFTDVEEVSAFAAEAVERIQQASIINGMGNGTFMPRESATRAQAAVVIFRLMGRG